MSPRQIQTDIRYNKRHMKNKTFTIAAIVLLIACALAIFAFIPPKSASAPEAAASAEQPLVLYYGDGCPHCANVDAFMSENDILAKLSVTQKEVYKNQTNAAELIARAKACGMTGDSVGVPFLYNGTDCIVGDQPIIAYLSQEAGLSFSAEVGP